MSKKRRKKKKKKEENDEGSQCCLQDVYVEADKAGSQQSYKNLIIFNNLLLLHQISKEVACYNILFTFLFSSVTTILVNKGFFNLSHEFYPENLSDWPADTLARAEQL